MANGPRGTKTQGPALGPPVPASFPPHAGPMAGAAANPFYSYPSLPPHPFWYGQVPFPFPPLQAQHYMALPTAPVLPTQDVDYPMITEWLVYCDNHPQRSGGDFTSLVPKFNQEGFQQLDQLTGERITVGLLSEWLDIGKGVADRLIRYAEKDIAAIHAGTFQMPASSHGRGLTQSYK
jgi:hypothetical protein